MAALAQTDTLTATVVTTMTFTGAPRLFEVVHHGDADNPVWIRTDGVDPVDSADECDVILPGERVPFVWAEAGDDIRLLAAVGTPTVTVRVLQ